MSEKLTQEQRDVLERMARGFVLWYTPEIEGWETYRDWDLAESDEDCMLEPVALADVVAFKEADYVGLATGGWADRLPGVLGITDAGRAALEANQEINQ